MRAHVVGQHGMLGSAIVRALQADGHEVGKWSNPEDCPELVFMCAARVGGIRDNIDHPVEFLRQNLEIAIKQAARWQGSRVLFPGSSCMYPRDCPQPMRETDLWTGPLEPTNHAYGVSKLTTLALVQAYRRQYGQRYIMPIFPNLYGPGDAGFSEPARAHVIPALVRRFQRAVRDSEPYVTLMGTGAALREFMHVDDAARAALWAMSCWNGDEPLNMGTGEEVSIASVATFIADLVGYHGQIQFSGQEGEDGMPRKVLDSRMARSMGWEPSIGLLEGLETTIKGVL